MQVRSMANVVRRTKVRLELPQISVPNRGPVRPSSEVDAIWPDGFGF
jgi:hypothetical protein